MRSRWSGLATLRRGQRLRWHVDLRRDLKALRGYQTTSNHVDSCTVNRQACHPVGPCRSVGLTMMNSYAAAQTVLEAARRSPDQ